MAKDMDEVREEFSDLVNMSAGEIEDWLDKDASSEVGIDAGDGESKGRKSAKHIIAIKHKNKSDLTDDDLAHMRKVVGYIKRHKAQKPEGSVKDTPWRYSLMNWGHDPLK